jgi:putative intracellular protease/amidase
MMKIARWFTGIGSLVILVVGILHGFKIKDIDAMIPASGLHGPLEGILKGCWLVFSGEMVALAVIAFVTSRMQGGGRIVLVCASTMAFNAALLFHFVGAATPIYITMFVMLMWLIGGSLQGKN